MFLKQGSEKLRKKEQKENRPSKNWREVLLEEVRRVNSKLVIPEDMDFEEIFDSNPMLVEAIYEVYLVKGDKGDMNENLALVRDRFVKSSLL